MRADLAEATAVAWGRIGQTGTWWSGTERVAIAAESRHAKNCAVCRARAAALSPAMVAGTHNRLASGLPEAAVEAIHRIRTDSGRIGEGWYLRLREAGLGEEAYVELVSVVAVVTAVDTFRLAAGLGVLTLPDAMLGVPSRRRPVGVRTGLGFVATLAPEDRGPEDPDLYGDVPGSRRRPGANIQRALSLVPEAMIHWWDLLEAQYQTSQQMRDFGRDYRAISHAQIELMAANVAALNRCEY